MYLNSDSIFTILATRDLKQYNKDVLRVQTVTFSKLVDELCGNYSHFLKNQKYNKNKLT